MKNYLNLRLSDTLAIVLIFAFTNAVDAQYDDRAGRPDQERFLYPVNPGKPGSLAGNMGELRSTHFHSGIDVRTNNQIGFPVVASKSGYVSRISMSPSGYGNVLYVRHPDGHTTLYAHLDHFASPIAEYVLQQQYEKKTFDIDLYPDENQFVVKQGEVIAISGNTGSSGGPHVHFDIRDENNDALDPLQFDFPELEDNVPPVVEKVAFVTLDENARINDRVGRFEFYVVRSGHHYSINPPILAHGNIGIELLAKDKFRANDPFYGGVKYITMHVDDKPLFSQAIEKINLSETRGIYTLMNFKTLRTTGKRFYKLYIDDGNRLDFYKDSPSDGKIFVTGRTDMKVEIALADAHRNSSKLSLRLRPTPVISDVKTLPQAAADPDVEWNDNLMQINIRPSPGADSLSALAHVYTPDTVLTVPAAYRSNAAATYLVNIKKHLPDSVVVYGRTIVTNLLTSIPSGLEYTYFSDRVNMHFPQGALFDTLYLHASFYEGDAEMFTLGNRTIPLGANITIDYKPKKVYDQDPRLGVYRVIGKYRTWLGGKWVNGRLSFQTRELGNFALLTDTQPPAIRPLSLNSHTVRFKISDDLSGISSYNAYINGSWLLMHYDAKTGILRSERLDKTQPLDGALKLLVKDNAGNEQIYTHQLP